MYKEYKKGGTIIFKGTNLLYLQPFSVNKQCDLTLKMN